MKLCHRSDLGWSWAFISRRVIQAIACASLLLFAPYATRGQNPPESRPTPPGSLVDVGGYRVHLYCAGSGSPTVMVVGAAFSFDWGLVQPEVAKFSRICTFDPSGTAWSDSFETAVRVLDPGAPANALPTCEGRVDEIHRLLTKAPVKGPYVLVGYSVGALWERLYAAEFPQNIVGAVIVDHAFLPRVNPPAHKPTVPAKAPSPGYTPPVLISETPIVFGFEDDVNFKKLPLRDQEYHEWAMKQRPVRPGKAMAENCFAQIERATEGHAYPFGDIPVAVISTSNKSPGYAQLQTSLLKLSRQSRQFVAQHSSHMVPIDEPGIIVNAVRWTVDTARARKADASGTVN